MSSAEPPGPVFTPRPRRGRVFATRRLVRSTDVTPGGRLRLDALARYLQEAAEDDLADVGWDEPYGWLLRRCEVAVRVYPQHGEWVRLTTFCSATGPRWAQRTTTLTGPGGDLMQATALWVAVTRPEGRPCPLGTGFHRHYGEAAGGRQVSARLSHPPPPSAPGRAWPLRATDFDRAGHVNNTVHWAAAEDVLSGLAWAPASADIEYHRPVLPGCLPDLVAAQAAGQALVWLLAGGQRLASIRLTR